LGHIEEPVFETLVEIGTLAQWAGAGGTFLAVLVALFKDEILRWRRKPDLTISASLTPPNCHKTTMTYTDRASAQMYRKVACYYLRIWVENIGKTRAERVQVYVSKLLRRSADGLFKEVQAFLPMNLRWSHGQQVSGGPEVFAEGISPGMGKHCDLGHVLDPKFRKDVGHDLLGVADDQTILVLDLEVPPATLTHLVPPGVYLLELRVAAANCSPVTKRIELTITGKWFEDERQMFLDGLGLKTTR
jgi:hypothetical protein